MCRACSSCIRRCTSSSTRTPTGTTRRSTRLAELGVVDTADFKGVYRGDFGQPPNPDALPTDRRSVPERMARGSWSRRATDEVLRPHRRPRHLGRADPLGRRRAGAAVSAALPEREAVALRHGAVACSTSTSGASRTTSSLYGGGQFELGIGRVQIQELASLFHPDMPNDVAPAAFNAARDPVAA